jgi:hypothetical protein
MYPLLTAIIRHELGVMPWYQAIRVTISNLQVANWTAHRCKVSSATKKWDIVLRTVRKSTTRLRAVSNG